MVLMLSLVVLPFLFSFGTCVVYDQLSDLKQTAFDFVVVGGGTAGAVLANRLSSTEELQILIVEAGPSHQGVLSTECPYLWTTTFSSPYDWNFTSTPQEALNGTVFHYPSGHILGGSSAITGMGYTRGSVDDLNRWAQVTGDPSWSWDQMLHYYKKHERWGPPADPRNTSGEFDPSVHGYDGRLSVSLYGLPQAIDSRVIAAAAELGDGFKYNLDMNSGYPLGTAWGQATIGGGEKSHSATAYLTPDVLERTNLHVLLNTKATRLVASTTDKGLPAFKKAELFGDDSANVTVQATKEVILSAGAAGSPRILMHSGIGAANELEPLGIKPLVNLPSVGKNLTDHPLFSVSFRANTSIANTRDIISINSTVYAEYFKLWTEERRGPMATASTNNFVWLRLPLHGHPDPSAGPNTPHLEMMLINGGSTEEARISAQAAVVTPSSRGTLKLASSDPFDPPLINPGLLSEQIDLILVREGIRSIRKFFAAHAWDGYVLEEAPPTANATTDEELDKVIRENVRNYAHITSSAAMSARDATYGVVDPDLKVKKVEGLRVVDASVMPFITVGHTLAPVYALAERAADLILQEWVH